MTPDVAPGTRTTDFSAEAFERLARARLTLGLPDDVLEVGAGPISGDHRLDELAPLARVKPRAAAVLIPVIDRPEGATVLLTLRSARLRDHSGQIALPGGKIDPADASPAAAALREAWEEVALAPDRVEPLGYLGPYLTGTGFLIIPTVAMVRTPIHLVPNAAEVDDVFEVPLAFLMEAANHQIGRREFGGQMRSFYVMPYRERRIWGVTAGVIRSLYERLYD